MIPAAARYEKQRVTVKGRSMAYAEQGAGDPIVFLHGNPTSSYLWRNVMPHLEGAGRQREFCRGWPNQEEVTVEGSHFIQEDSPTRSAGRSPAGARSSPDPSFDDGARGLPAGGLATGAARTPRQVKADQRRSFTFVLRLFAYGRET